jgi:hypothetical protein
VINHDVSFWQSHLQQLWPEEADHIAKAHVPEVQCRSG